MNYELLAKADKKMPNMQIQWTRDTRGEVLALTVARASNLVRLDPRYE